MKLLRNDIREYWKVNLLDGSEMGSIFESRSILLDDLVELTEQLLDSVSDEKGP